jgi:hypothetical protein
MQLIHSNGPILGNDSISLIGNNLARAQNSALQILFPEVSK